MPTIVSFTPSLSSNTSFASCFHKDIAIRDVGTSGYIDNPEIYSNRESDEYRVGRDYSDPFQYRNNLIVGVPYLFKDKYPQPLGILPPYPTDDSGFTHPNIDTSFYLIMGRQAQAGFLTSFTTTLSFVLSQINAAWVGPYDIEFFEWVPGSSVRIIIDENTINERELTFTNPNNDINPIVRIPANFNYDDLFGFATQKIYPAYYDTTYFPPNVTCRLEFTGGQAAAWKTINYESAYRQMPVVPSIVESKYEKRDSDDLLLGADLPHIEIITFYKSLVNGYPKNVTSTLSASAWNMKIDNDLITISDTNDPSGNTFKKYWGNIKAIGPGSNKDWLKYAIGVLAVVDASPTATIGPFITYNSDYIITSDIANCRIFWDASFFGGDPSNPYISANIEIFHYEDWKDVGSVETSLGTFVIPSTYADGYGQLDLPGFNFDRPDLVYGVIKIRYTATIGHTTGMGAFSQGYLNFRLFLSKKINVPAWFNWPDIQGGAHYGYIDPVKVRDLYSVTAASKNQILYYDAPPGQMSYTLTDRGPGTANQIITFTPSGGHQFLRAVSSPANGSVRGIGYAEFKVNTFAGTTLPSYGDGRAFRVAAPGPVSVPTTITLTHFTPPIADIQSNNYVITGTDFINFNSAFNSFFKFTAPQTGNYIVGISGSSISSLNEISASTQDFLCLDGPTVKIDSLSNIYMTPRSPTKSPPTTRPNGTSWIVSSTPDISGEFNGRADNIALWNIFYGSKGSFTFYEPLEGMRTGDYTYLGGRWVLNISSVPAVKTTIRAEAGQTIYVRVSGVDFAYTQNVVQFTGTKVFYQLTNE